MPVPSWERPVVATRWKRLKMFSSSSLERNSGTVTRDNGKDARGDAAARVLAGEDRFVPAVMDLDLDCALHTATPSEWVSNDEYAQRTST